MRWLFILSILIVPMAGAAAEGLPLPAAPDAATIAHLPVTSSGIGNSLLRGGPLGADPTQTYLQLYTSDLAASADGFVYLTTTWEEGLMPAGIYRDGDALPERVPYGAGSGDAVAVSDTMVVYAPGGGLEVFARTPGRGIDPGSRRRFELGDPKPAIKGLALDPARGRIYWTDGVQVRAVKLADGSADPGFALDVPRAARLAVDHEGAVWVLQAPRPAGREPLKATAFGSEPDAPGHEPERAQILGDDQAVFIAKDKNASFIGLDFGKPVSVSALRFSVSADGTRFRELRVQGSVAGRAGPWTDLSTFDDRPNGWPEEWLPLDPMKRWRCIQFTGPALWMKEFQAFTPTVGLPGRILRFSPAGMRLPQEIHDVTNPVAIASDLRTRRLLIADGGPEQQVRAYTDLAGKPRLDETFGSKGRLGVAGGRAGGALVDRGRVGPLRFETIRGIGVDATGTVSICHVGASGASQTVLESASSAGTPRWRMEGLAFLDSAAVDPGDETALFSCLNRFQLDWTKPLGGGWTWAASTVDKQHYPDDGRAGGGMSLVYGVRRIHGQRFLITTTQAQIPLAVYRFAAPAGGDVAIPCAVICSRTSGGPWPPNQPLGFGPFIWRDRNGDGRCQREEYEKILRDDVDVKSMEIDAAGDLWILGNTAGKPGLHRLPAGAALGPSGVPGWTWASASRQRFEVPGAPAATPIEVQGFKVDAAGQAVFLFGFNPDFPNALGGNTPLGRLLMRCRIVGDTLVPTHTVQLPYDCNLSNAEHDQPYSASLAGDTLFVGYMQRMAVLAYRSADLALIGRIDIGPQSQGCLFDGPPELVTSKVKDGYVLSMPQYQGNAITLVRWSGATTGWLPAPALTAQAADAGAVALAWAPVTGATGWCLERRCLERGGWAAWTPLATAPAGAVGWRDAPVGAAAAAYRLRATGPNGAASDWSQTAYARGLPSPGPGSDLPKQVQIK